MVNSKTKETANIHLEETETKTQIVRKLPKILNDYVSQTEWVSLCDRLDDALSPTSTFKRLRKNLNILLTINVVLLLIDFFITQIILHRADTSSSNIPELEVPSNSSSTSNSDNLSTNDSNGVFAFFQAFNKNTNSTVGDVIMLSHFILTSCLFVMSTVTLIVWKYSMINDIQSKLRIICAGFVLDKPSLSYNLKNSNSCQRRKLILPLFIQFFVTDGSLIVPLDKMEQAAFHHHDEENPKMQQQQPEDLTEYSTDFEEDSSVLEEVIVFHQAGTDKQQQQRNNTDSKIEYDALEDIELNTPRSDQNIGELKKKKQSSSKKIKISSSKRSDGDSCSRKSSMSKMTILDDNSQDTTTQEKRKSGKSKKKYTKVEQITTASSSAAAARNSLSPKLSPKRRKNLDQAPSSPMKKSSSRRVAATEQVDIAATTSASAPPPSTKSPSKKSSSSSRRSITSSFRPKKKQQQGNDEENSKRTTKRKVPKALYSNFLI